MSDSFEKGVGQEKLNRLKEILSKEADPEGQEKVTISGRDGISYGDNNRITVVKNIYTSDDPPIKKLAGLVAQITRADPKVPNKEHVWEKLGNKFGLGKNCKDMTIWDFPKAEAYLKGWLKNLSK